MPPLIEVLSKNRAASLSWSPKPRAAGGIDQRPAGGTCSSTHRSVIYCACPAATVVEPLL
jgi:hypothetical protein